MKSSSSLLCLCSQEQENHFLAAAFIVLRVRVYVRYIFDMIFYEFKVSVSVSAPPVGNLLWVVVVCPKARCFNRKTLNKFGKGKWH